MERNKLFDLYGILPSFVVLKRPRSVPMNIAGRAIIKSEQQSLETNTNIFGEFLFVFISFPTANDYIFSESIESICEPIKFSLGV